MLRMLPPELRGLVPPNPVEPAVWPYLAGVLWGLLGAAASVFLDFRGLRSQVEGVLRFLTAILRHPEVVLELGGLCLRWFGGLWQSFAGIWDLASTAVPSTREGWYDRGKAAGNFLGTILLIALTLYLGVPAAMARIAPALTRVVATVKVEHAVAVKGFENTLAAGRQMRGLPPLTVPELVGAGGPLARVDQSLRRVGSRALSGQEKATLGLLLSKARKPSAKGGKDAGRTGPEPGKDIYSTLETRTVPQAVSGIKRYGYENVKVRTREAAERVFFEIWGALGFSDTSGLRGGTELREAGFSKRREYHWDDKPLKETGEFHHGGPHLQVHDERGTRFRIFWEKPKTP